jgi:hypothetical protein
MLTAMIIDHDAFLDARGRLKYTELSLLGACVRENSDVPAWLGLKAPAWARLLGARAQEKWEPGREPSEPWAKLKPEA